MEVTAEAASRIKSGQASTTINTTSSLPGNFNTSAAAVASVSTTTSVVGEKIVVGAASGSIGATSSIDANGFVWEKHPQT